MKHKCATVQRSDRYRSITIVTTSTKARGAFFTPPELATYLADWAIRSDSDVVIEPSCGEAAFLLAATERFGSLGAVPKPEQLIGYEIHEDSIAEAHASLREANGTARIECGDFFDVFPTPTADAVIGNPPYVRYQSFTGLERAKAQRAALAAGVRIDGLASSWAAFVVHASQFLNDEGRLALVLPAELLHVKYAAPVRRYLMKRFARISLVTFEKLVFPGVTSEVVLLLAERRGESDSIELLQMEDLGDLESHRITRRTWTPSDSSHKWTAALVGNESLEFYYELLEQRFLVPLSEWGRPYLGAVSGNNRYFRLTPSRATQLGLGEDDVTAVLPGGASGMRGTTYSRELHESLADADETTVLFRPVSTPSAAALNYIADGTSQGVDQAYKCRIRDPWWIVPLPPVADLFLTYMSHDSPRFIRNEAGVQALNAVHGVRLATDNPLLKQVFPIAALNSATALGAELVGRSYGGGVLKLEPREADLLPIPSETIVLAAADDLLSLRDTVEGLLAARLFDDARAIVDDVLFSRMAPSTRSRVEELREARNRLRGRRLRRTTASQTAKL